MKARILPDGLVAEFVKRAGVGIGRRDDGALHVRHIHAVQHLVCTEAVGISGLGCAARSAVIHDLAVVGIGDVERDRAAHRMTKRYD